MWQFTLYSRFFSPSIGISVSCFSLCISTILGLGCLFRFWFIFRCCASVNAIHFSILFSVYKQSRCWCWKWLILVHLPNDKVTFIATIFNGLVFLQYDAIVHIAITYHGGGDINKMHTTKWKISIDSLEIIEKKVHKIIKNKNEGFESRMHRFKNWLV